MVVVVMDVVVVMEGEVDGGLIEKREKGKRVKSKE